MTTAREIAHQYMLACRFNDKFRHRTTSGHSPMCDELAAKIDAALEQSFNSGRDQGYEEGKIVGEELSDA